jgi:hypothetical protein
MKPTLIAYEPLQHSGLLYAREFVDDLTAKHQNYTHTIGAVGGFEQASFVLKGDRAYLDAWFDDGLMRRVVFYNPEGAPVWEGFVEQMKYSVGTIQKTKGMKGMYNRVYMRFSPLNTATGPPIAGIPITLPYDDADSQSKWGIKSTVVNGGELTHAEAYAWAQVILRTASEPQLGETVNTQESGSPNIVVTLKGYFEVLNWVPYLSVSLGELPAHQVVTEVLQYFNVFNSGWVSTASDWMDWNHRPERRVADEYHTCWKVITNIIKRGGYSGERWVGGFYQDRTFIYKPAEDFKTLYGEYLFYARRLNDPAQRIYDENGVEVRPWDVVPDRILMTVDV